MLSARACVWSTILPVWVDFTSLKGLPCAPGPATTRRGMLVTIMVRAGVQVRAVVRVVRPLERIKHSNNRKYPHCTRRRSILVGVTGFKLTISMCSLIR